MTAPSGDIFTIEPVDHDNIFGEGFECIGIKFVHIIPHHHAFAEFAGDDGMNEVDHIAEEFLFAVIGFGFRGTFLAVTDIERFIAADMDVRGGEEFGNFRKIFFEECFDFRIGKTEFLFDGIAESTFYIAMQFAEMRKPFIRQQKFGVADGSEAGYDIDAFFLRRTR